MTHGYLSDHEVKLGVSTCLLGQRVRYDGRDQRHDWLVEVLGKYVSWVPVCPEVELGLGVPRPPIKLVRNTGETTTRADGPPPLQQGGPQQLCLIDTRDGRDLSRDMGALAQRRVTELATLGIAGFVLKSKSPSCGMSDVKVFAGPWHDTELDRSGRGLFAAALMRAMPGLPVVEERALDASVARRAFVDQVCAFHRRFRSPQSR